MQYTESLKEDISKSPSSMSLGQRSSRGLAYYFLQSIGTKVLSFIGQILLTWLLLPEDFGVVSLAITIGVLISAIQFGSVRDWLMLNAKDFDRWSPPAFWFSFVSGLGSFLLTCAVAPLAGYYFSDSRLPLLIFVIAVQNLCTPLTSVSDTKLQLDLRFGLLATAGACFTLFTMLLSVLMASLKYGPISLILPAALSSVLRLGWLIYIAPPKMKWHPDWTSFIILAKTGSVLGLASMFFLLANWLDYLILGRLYNDKAIVGGYYWAFALSSQTNQILGQNISGVLQPALSQLSETPDRKVAAFIRVTRLLGVVGFPLAFLQALVSDPGVRLIFSPKWFPSIAILQVLCIASGPQIVAAGFGAMLRSQGRFILYLVISFLHALFFAASVYVGARAGGGLGAAYGVAVFTFCLYPFSIYMTLRGCSLSPAFGTMKLLLMPFLLSLIAMCLAWLSTGFMLSEFSTVSLVLKIIIRTLVMCGVYMLLLRMILPSSWQEIMSQISSHLPFLNQGKKGQS